LNFVGPRYKLFFFKKPKQIRTIALPGQSSQESKEILIMDRKVNKYILSQKINKIMARWFGCCHKFILCGGSLDWVLWGIVNRSVIRDIERKKFRDIKAK